MIPPGSAADPLVAVCVVTYRAATDLLPFVAHLERQDYPAIEWIFVDNASDDGTGEQLRDVAHRAHPRVQVIPQLSNTGFAAGMNRAVAAASHATFVLALNADTRPAPDFVRRLVGSLVEAEQTGWKIGAVTGRLVRLRESGANTPRLDACGMHFTLSWRHFDRGSGEVDRGQLAKRERVVGGTGAATLYRRVALEDVVVDGWIFDEDFHSFREDAELALRLQERGWEAIYEPSAVAEHRRFNLPERRSAMPAMVNLHSLKNRYLLRLYHQGGWNLILTAVPTAVRDLAALAWVLVRERSSLGAYRWLWRERRRLLARRRSIRARRTVPSSAIDRWFLRRSLPL